MDNKALYEKKMHLKSITIDENFFFSMWTYLDISIKPENLS